MMDIVHPLTQGGNLIKTEKLFRKITNKVTCIEQVQKYSHKSLEKILVEQKQKQK